MLTVADSIRVVWPLGKVSLLKNIKANQLIAIAEGTSITNDTKVSSPSKIFSPVESLIGYEHVEYGSNDFQRQPLLKDNAVTRRTGNGRSRC